ncbi:nucleolin 2 isoform X8 [Glycine max]|uniref:nucleolin 2 isoform X8 n=1 Tax=Glycine max TaxID=3847 RepID=UPI0003DE8249|nr:nucleolin 2 isoform X8 [Glycine max]|eukprot:XP_006605441.1 nucleolin 2 isoform X8 [Glycine max]
MDNKSDQKVYYVRTAALLLQHNDEKQVSAKEQTREMGLMKRLRIRENMSGLRHVIAGATAVPPLRIGKREGENEDEQQVTAKKQKRDEVAEEQRIMDEIVSDDSFADFEPDKNSEAKKDSLSKQEKKGKPDSANCSSSLESLADGSEEDAGNMDIDEGYNSEECSEGTQEKMQVLPVKSSENSEKGIEEKDSKAPQENPKMLSTPNERNAGSKTIVTRNLSYSVERADLENLFKPCGEVVDVRLHTDAEGRFRGFGHVEFATAEAAQKSKIIANCKDLSATSKTIYASNLAYSMEKDDMEFLFKNCGEIVDIRLHTDHNGRFKGHGHVEFATTEAAQKALELNNKVYLGRPVGVFIAKGKGEYTSNRSNWSKSFHQSEQTKPIKSTESSEYCEEEVEGKASNSYWESSKRVATLKEQNAPPKTIYVRNLSYRVEQADMENLFKECGKIVDVRLHRNHNGRLNGFGQVEFATAEAAKKALELHNTELLRRPIGVDLAEEKGEYTYSRSNWSNSFQKCERAQSPTVFVTGFDSSLPAEKLKASLEEHFGSCGEIQRISIPTFPDSGAVKGFAHLGFKDVVSVRKALHLDQNELGGFPLRVEKAKPRRDNWGIGSGRDGRDNWGIGSGRDGGDHQFGGRDGSGYTSRVGWGRSGGGGWHSLHFSDEDSGRKNHSY